MDTQTWQAPNHLPRHHHHQHTPPTPASSDSPYTPIRFKIRTDHGDPQGLGVGYGGGCGYQPTAPSVSSRIRSACPLWRAYSSIMWT